MSGICIDVTQRVRAEQQAMTERRRAEEALRFGESHGRRCYEYLFNRDEP